MDGSCLVLPTVHEESTDLIAKCVRRLLFKHTYGVPSPASTVQGDRYYYNDDCLPSDAGKYAEKDMHPCFGGVGVGPYSSKL